MTAQRYVAVSFPLQAARWNSKRGAAFVLVLAALIAFLGNVVHLVTFRVQPYNGQYRGRCDVGSGLGEYIQMRVYPWIDSALYFLFPTVAISVLNVLMYHALQSAGRFKRRTAARGHTRTNGTTSICRDSSGRIGDPPDITQSIERSLSSRYGDSNSNVFTTTQGLVSSGGNNSDLSNSGGRKERSPTSVHLGIRDRIMSSTTSTTYTTELDGRNDSSHDPRQRDSSTATRAKAISNGRVHSSVTSTRGMDGTRLGSSAQLTRMLLTVSIAFLILTLPIGVFVVVSRYWNPPSGYEKALFNLFRDVTESLMYTNHAINFLLYCLSGGRFRAKAASIIFRSCRAGPRTDQDMTSARTISSIR
ncbi:hypothetical protein BaRGS_00037186 [Batillaria attramentaria]|uniref:G-protein coupled receptors family 1 profile domain-containing protein n=1 Tax=Batillaria attramentaria TaxID=370345 RepID=A0ABD0J9F4_9CAEN